MGHEELDMHDIPPSLAARAMGVSVRTVHMWLAEGEIKGDQTPTGRWWVSVKSCRARIRKTNGLNSRAESNFDHVLMEGELPKSPFAHDPVDVEEEAVSYA